MIRTMTKAAAIAALLIAITPAATAATPQAIDLTSSFRDAGVTVDRLQVYEIAGIVVIRGRSNDKADAEALSRRAQSLGYTRVANMITTITHDDSAIARKAEVELTMHRSLDGCRFAVTSDRGNVRVAGKVTHELQKDVAAAVLRRIDGVQSVELDLTKF